MSYEAIRKNNILRNNSSVPRISSVQLHCCLELAFCIILNLAPASCQIVTKTFFFSSYLLLAYCCRCRTEQDQLSFSFFPLPTSIKMQSLLSWQLKDNMFRVPQGSLKPNQVLRKSIICPFLLHAGTLSGAGF